MCKLSARFYHNRSRRYQKSDIFVILPACRPTILQRLLVSWLAGWLQPRPVLLIALPLLLIAQALAADCGPLADDLESVSAYLIDLSGKQLV